jgi:hypothetical protein
LFLYIQIMIITFNMSFSYIIQVVLFGVNNQINLPSLVLNSMLSGIIP